MTIDSRGELPVRYCSTCGASLVQLERPHVARECNECGKTKYLVELDQEAGGIRVRKGDKFTIPAGWLQISLHPSSRGKLFRPGLPFLLKQLFYDGSSEQAAAVESTLDRYVQAADKILDDSKLLKDYDLNSPDGGEQAWEFLKEHRSTREWYAALIGSFVKVVRRALDEGNVNMALWGIHHATAAHAMIVVLEPVFESTLWRGYLTNQVVYEAATAASSTPVEAEAIKKLGTLFQDLDEQTLHAWTESGLPIGPRIGVSSLPEPLLLALARWHLAQFERRREDQKNAIEQAKVRKELQIKWTAIGVTIGGILVGLILKALGT